MNDAFGTQGILDVIRRLAARGATGRLQVTTGMTEGALFFARGQLMDAHLGRLTGFQAINALVSVPDGRYEFDPSVAPPVESSIAPNERLLLKDFFGIDVAEDGHANDAAESWFADESPPEQVVPLAAIAPEYSDERSREDDEATLVRPRPPVAAREPVAPLPIVQPEPVVAAREPEPVFAARDRDPDLAAVRLRNRPAARSMFVPVLLVILLAALMAAAAVALRYRWRKSESSASVAPAAQTSTPADVARQPVVPVQQPAPASTQQRATQPTQQPAPQTTQQPDTTAAVPDLNGNWTVVNTVEQTSYEPYRNMQVGFNVAINQAGRDFTGTGEKISENGRSLNGSGRTAIQVKGTIDGDQVHATFSESGAARKTNGQFVWRIDRGAGGLTGTFASTAARTSGKSTARKL